MLGGTAGEQIPDGSRNPERRKPDDMAILPAGDADGRTYEELYVEHAPVARRVALSMVPCDVADNIVAEAFTRVLGAIRPAAGQARRSARICSRRCATRPTTGCAPAAARP